MQSELPPGLDYRDPSPPSTATLSFDAVAAIAERFAQIVARFPDRIAVKSGHRELTYRQLDTLAERLARHVAVRCADEASTVALALGHGVDLSLGALACLKAGRVFVPLDRREPPLRLRRILDDARGAAARRRSTAAGGSRRNRRDEHPRRAADPDVTLAQIRRRADDLAFVLYTSGSTGTPKGVMVANRAVVARVAEHNRFGVGPEIADRAQVRRMNLIARCSRRALVSLDDGVLDLLAAWLREEEITISLECRRYSSVSARRSPEGSDRRRCASSITPARRSSAATSTPSASTSRSAACCQRPRNDRDGDLPQLRIDHASPLGDGVVPVGGAVEGMDVALVDAHGSAVGEARSARSSSAGTFRPATGAVGSHCRALRLRSRRHAQRRLSHRRSRALPSGRLRSFISGAEFPGQGPRPPRRGRRSEPAARAHPGVAEAAVVGRRQDGGDVRLAGFAVPRGRDGPDADELLRFLRARLPDYMVRAPSPCRRSFRSCRTARSTAMRSPPSTARHRAPHATRRAARRDRNGSSPVVERRAAPAIGGRRRFLPPWAVARRRALMARVLAV
jgi:hypothetical protein